MPSSTRVRAAGRTALAAIIAVSAAGLAGCGTGSSDPPAVISTPTSDSPYKGITLNGKDTLPDVPLSDTSGDTWNPSRHAKNHLTLLFFGYTHCPDICPTTLADLASVMRELPARTRDHVRVLFVGVDTKRDTPKVLRSYLNRFDRSFIGLTGKPAQIREAAKDAHVYYQIPKNTTGNYPVSHSAEVRVYDQKGRARLLYTADTKDTDMAHDLRLLGKDLR